MLELVLAMKVTSIEGLLLAMEMLMVYNLGINNTTEKSPWNT